MVCVGWLVVCVVWLESGCYWGGCVPSGIEVWCLMAVVICVGVRRCVVGVGCGFAGVDVVW